MGKTPIGVEPLRYTSREKDLASQQQIPGGNDGKKSKSLGCSDYGFALVGKLWGWSSIGG